MLPYSIEMVVLVSHGDLDRGRSGIRSIKPDAACRDIANGHGLVCREREHQTVGQEGIDCRNSSVVGRAEGDAGDVKERLSPGNHIDVHRIVGNGDRNVSRGPAEHRTGQDHHRSAYLHSPFNHTIPLVEITEKRQL